MKLRDVMKGADCSAVESAHMWLEYRRKETLPPVPKVRCFRAGYRFTSKEIATLRQMAKQAVWQEVGGRGMGWQGQTNPLAAKSQRQMNEEGNGRTVWVGMPEWAKGFDGIAETVEKAIAGGTLGRRQRLLLQVMLQEAAEYQPAQPSSPSAEEDETPW